MGKKILLIDDEPDFTELTGSLLSFHDFTVETVNDPARAEPALAAATGFDLVVTDIMMPNLNGIDLIKRLRARPEYAKIPIIALTAKNLSDEERKVLLNNRVELLTKPFEPRGLIDRIVNLLTA